MRVVFDTNIYVSALAIPGGNAEEAYLEAIRGTFELFTSVAILTETARVHQSPTSTSSMTNRTIASSSAPSPHKPSSSSQEIAISWRSSTMQTSP